MIQISELNFSYSSNKPVLVIPEFSVNKGETLFVYGPSGCGKTTFLEILCGILQPESGELNFLDKAFSTLSLSERDQMRADHIGYVFQSHNLIPYLTARQNIELPCWLSAVKKSRLKKSLLEEVNFLAERLGVSEVIDKRVTELSLGQSQRVAVARALMGSPELILADEPTSALDFDHKQKFLQLLFELSKLVQTTVVFVSHDQTLLPQFSRSVSLPEINQRSL
jgi:putative ABC transport system ATP-binding protein